MLLNSAFVDLRGKEGTTVLVNSTPDTIKLSYIFFNWLPYTETRDVISLAPGQKDSIRMLYNFPDFVMVNNRLGLYNGPGGRLVCDIKAYRSGKPEVVFTGAYAQENTYYFAYHEFLKRPDQESRPYYNVSDLLKDWNQFPAKADSITQIRLKFLDQFTGELPAWFSKHEHRRLLYNQYFRMLNALMSKEFYGGKPISVSYHYFDFEKLLNKDDDMVLSDTYLYCMNDYFVRQSNLAKTQGMAARLYAIDSLYHQTDIGDVNLMCALGRLYRVDKGSYDKVIGQLKFKQPERKLMLDSLIQSRLGTPYMGKPAPVMALTNAEGKAVPLADYKGKMIIVNFWAVWCGPCKVEFPAENKLYTQYQNKGLVVINVCFDSEREQWLRDTKKYNLQMVNLFTNRSDYNKLLRQYNLSAPPRSILINREGKVADNYFKRASLLTEQDIQNILK